MRIYALCLYTIYVEEDWRLQFIVGNNVEMILVEGRCRIERFPCLRIISSVALSLFLDKRSRICMSGRMLERYNAGFDKRDCHARFHQGIDSSIASANIIVVI